jgi:hypothetical protein
MILTLIASFASPALAAPDQTYQLSPEVASQSLPAPDEGAERLEKQAVIRSHQLQLHQRVAAATLGAMALTVGLGLYQSNLSPTSPWNPPVLLPLHQSLGGLTGGLYLTAATLALTAPKGYDVTESGGFDTVTAHRSLAWLHGTALGATAVYGLLTATGQAGTSGNVIHGWLGGATLALMALSAGVIAFEF